MKNIELRRKVIGPEGYILINTVVGPKNTWMPKSLKNEVELWISRILEPRRVIIFASAIIAVVIISVAYFAWSHNRSTIDNQTWTNIDLSNSQYDYTADVE